MTYYKIIIDSHVVDAGFVFLKWNENRHKMYICDENEAQFVQSFDQKTVYRDEWLKPAPDGVTFTAVQVVVIDKNEFDDIRALLDGDEEIPVQPEPVVETVVESEPEKPVEETPISIAEMRVLIKEQQEQISQLAATLAEIKR